jgi:hemoglobin-like flavoprotein
MTPKDVDLVERSLPAILALRDGFPSGLEQRQAHPFEAPLFAGGDADRQPSMLIDAVAMGLQALRPEAPEGVASSLSQLHARSGVEPHHFRSAGERLVTVFAQELGAQFSAEMAHAWSVACEWVGRMVLQPRHPFAA